jgi:hypothetical protein
MFCVIESIIGCAEMAGRSIGWRAAPGYFLGDGYAQRDNGKQYVTRRGFYHNLIEVVVAGIALRTNILCLFQAPEIMPHGSVFIYVGGIGAIVLGNNFGMAATTNQE